MNTLLLRLVGPMQSWGVQSRFSVRETGLEPSKSGVIGLLCAALGRPRNEPIDDMVKLKMGVRADREGRLSCDYHVAGTGGYLKAGGKVERGNVIPSNRYYLSDAAFLVGLESDQIDFLQRIQSALHHPVWQLYLGRKAFVPSEMIALEDGLISGGELEAALQTYPYLGRGDPPERLRGIIDDPDGDQIRPDQPISFAERRFGQRRVRTLFFSQAPIRQVSQVDREEKM